MRIPAFRQALKAIALSRGSNKLFDRLGDINSSLANTVHAASQQTVSSFTQGPVGLRNIGNTCYLNSLLQMLFSIKPLRQLVLNFEQYETDLANATMERKKVGSRKVSKAEVERSVKCESECPRRLASADMLYSCSRLSWAVQRHDYISKLLRYTRKGVCAHGADQLDPRRAYPQSIHNVAKSSNPRSTQQRNRRTSWYLLNPNECQRANAIGYTAFDKPSWWQSNHASQRF